MICELVNTNVQCTCYSEDSSNKEHTDNRRVHVPIQSQLDIDGTGKYRRLKQFEINSNFNKRREKGNK